MIDGLFMAKDGNHLALLARMANRHGLIAGATGAGKTVTPRVIAENFCSAYFAVEYS